MRIHLINPSDISFGVAVITPRWLYVLAQATPREYGDPQVVDETLEQLDPETVEAGDVVGIGIHTGNVRRGYQVGRMAREKGAYVVYGGIHATLFPDEPRDGMLSTPEVAVATLRLIASGLTGQVFDIKRHDSQPAELVGSDH